MRNLSRAGLAALALAACAKKEPPAPSAAPGASATAPSAAADKPTITVAAASDLTFAFAALGKAYEARNGQKVVFDFGSSGQIARQLTEGAPFDLFAAANQAFVDDAVKGGACDGATKALYAQGHLVLWARAGGALTATTSLQDLTDAKFAKIAIANPEHAPYGKAAREALEAAGVWDAVQPRIVYGENIKQTMQFAESGNAEVAIVALSLALGGGKEGVYAPIDPSLHKPLDQALVVCNHGGNRAGAKAFAAYIMSPEGRALMNEYGFVLPGEPAQAAAK
jgi:molybdate transport system substrate-binding protein